VGKMPHHSMVFKNALSCNTILNNTLNISLMNVNIRHQRSDCRDEFEVHTVLKTQHSNGGIQKKLFSLCMI
jgi:hypothetical protein